MAIDFYGGHFFCSISKMIACLLMKMRNSARFLTEGCFCFHSHLQWKLHVIITSYTVSCGNVLLSYVPWWSLPSFYFQIRTPHIKYFFYTLSMVKAGCTFKFFSVITVLAYNSPYAGIIFSVLTLVLECSISPLLINVKCIILLYLDWVSAIT